MKKLLVLIGAISLGYYVATASETVKGAKKDYEIFKQEMTTKMESLEKQIAELKQQAANKGGTAKTKTVQELESARDSLKAKMNSFSESSKEGWESAKKGMADAMNSLNVKVQKALKE